MTVEAPPRPALTLRPPALHVSPPRAYTVGDIVARECRRAGWVPDPEQELALEDIFAYGPDGKVASSQVLLEAARQNLKTGTIIATMFGWLFVTKARSITWSAHEYESVAEPFEKLAELIETHDWLERRVRSVQHATGKQRITMADGRTLKCKARTKSGGRGLGAEKVCLDEYFAAQAAQVGSLWPLMSATPDPQLLAASSAAHEDSDLQRDMVDRALAGAPRVALLSWRDVKPRQCLHRDCTHVWGSPGCCYDEEDRWAAANPSIAWTPEEQLAGRRITAQYVRDERTGLPPAEFARERMGWGDESPDLPPIPLQAWAASEREDVKVVDGWAIGFDTSPKRSRSSVVLVGRNPKGRLAVKVLKTGTGGDWVARLACKWAERLNLDTVYRVPGEAKMHDQAITDEGFAVREWTPSEYGVGCSDVYDAIARGKGILHRPSVDLDAAVKGVRLRPNDEGVSVWSRARSSVDITLVVAMTAALRGHLSEPPTSWVVDVMAEED